MDRRIRQHGQAHAIKWTGVCDKNTKTIVTYTIVKYKQGRFEPDNFETYPAEPCTLRQ